MSTADIIIAILPFLALFLLFAGMAILCLTKRCKLTERFLRLMDRRTK